jgi:hypothetical protein
MEVPAASTSRSRSPSQGPRYQFSFDSTSLPVDVSLREAELFQEHTRAVGLSWYDTKSQIKIEFCVISSSKFSQRNVEPELFICESATECGKAFQVSVFRKSWNVEKF